jgi:glycosyltransferase involved in cell wall biosynthesis
VPHPPAHTPRLVAENRLRYDGLVALVGHHAAAGDPERVLRSATLAAGYAWTAPTGLLSDPALERLVVASVRPEGRPTVDGTRTGGRVLHVLSEAFSVGGHTRLAWRWIHRDPRPADLVLTNHGGPIPDQLTAAVVAAGGRVHDLRAAEPTLLGRVTALRALMDQADLVVLHVHPYDAVVLAAANLPGVRPPVILENHVDHAFWLGVGGADVVSHFRSFGERLSLELRGVPSKRSALVPLPIEATPATEPRESLRRALGLAPDAVVAVCVASGNKLSPLWGKGMDHLLDRALTWCSQLVVLLVGAPPTGAWARLAERYPGRLRPVGFVPDPTPFYTAADVYLESYPTRAGTSVLEAALFGLPVLTLVDLPPEDRLYVYQAESPGLVGQPRAETPEQYVRMLRALVADPELRTQRGAEARAAVAAVHCGEGWTSAMEALYEQARGSSAVDVHALDEAGEDARYAAMLQAFVFGGATEPLEPSGVLAPLDHLDDDQLRADAFAVSNRHRGPSLSVRIAPGWEREPAWTARLLALASDHPRLAVSLPFVPDDDVAGSRSTAVLVELLAGVGLTPESCGDISVDTHAPQTLPSVSGELPATTEALDWLERLISSPGWELGREPVAAAAR